MNIEVTQGSMGVVALAVDLFGINRIDPGSWGTPVYVYDLTEDEYKFAIEFFAEYDLKVSVTTRERRYYR